MNSLPTTSQDLIMWQLTHGQMPFIYAVQEEYPDMDFIDLSTMIDDWVKRMIKIEPGMIKIDNSINYKQVTVYIAGMKILTAHDKSDLYHCVTTNGLECA